MAKQPKSLNGRVIAITGAARGIGKATAAALVREGARVGIPNDPTNGGRVLLVLQDRGLIKLRPEAGLKATPLDVVDNPKKLKFVEIAELLGCPLNTALGRMHKAMLKLKELMA